MEIELRTFPSSDRDFGRFARSVSAELRDPPAPDALQRRIRARYPAAIVQVQSELARHGDGPPIWYVFRSGSLGQMPDLPVDEAPAWAIVGDDRRFLEVSPALAEIVELPAALIVGRRLEEFGNPDDPSIRSDIARLWQEFRVAGSIASSMRFNYGDGRPRELGYRLIANAVGPGHHRLTVWERSTD